MHVSKVFPSLRDTLPRDLMASVVAFLEIGRAHV